MTKVYLLLYITEARNEETIVVGVYETADKAIAARDRRHSSAAYLRLRKKRGGGFYDIDEWSVQ